VVSTRERQKLRQAYGRAIAPGATIAKCAIGLLLLLAIALLGLTANEESPAGAVVNASQAGRGR
jgi:hypothetical protein